MHHRIGGHRQVRGFQWLRGEAEAFTLIELLIVVAIIAILAAIAVPNFLEAQNRSKVSRAKTDMRSVSVGLESYKVDRNRYPPAYSPNESPAGTINPRIRRLKPLSTPVASWAGVDWSTAGVGGTTMDDAISTTDS